MRGIIFQKVLKLKNFEKTSNLLKSFQSVLPCFSNERVNCTLFYMERPLLRKNVEEGVIFKLKLINSTLIFNS